MTAECVPSAQTVNQQYYIEVLTKLREGVRREKETIVILGKRVDFAPGQRASPLRTVCAANFS